MSLMKQKLPPKKKNLTLEEKIKILDELSEGETTSTLATLFNVHIKTIKNVKKNEDKIRKYASAGSSTISKRKECGDINILKMEEALVTWINNYTHKRIPLDNDTIRQEALKIYKQMGDPTPRQQNSFNASKIWLRDFKKRFGFDRKHKDVDSQDMKFSQKPALTEADVIETITDPHIDIITNEDSKNSSEKSSDISITDVKKGLKLAKELEHYFMKKDSSSLRKSVFQENLNIGLGLYFELLRTSENKKALFFKSNLQNVSSDELLPIRRKKTQILENDSNRNISSDEDNLSIPKNGIRISQPFQDDSH